MNKRWVQNDKAYILMLTLPDGEKEFARMVFIDGIYVYQSTFINVEYDDFQADSLEDAKYEVEYNIADFIKEKIYYYEQLLEQLENENE